MSDRLTRHEVKQPDPWARLSGRGIRLGIDNLRYLVSVFIVVTVVAICYAVLRVYFARIENEASLQQVRLEERMTELLQGGGHREISVGPDGALKESVKPEQAARLEEIKTELAAFIEKFKSTRSVDLAHLMMGRLQLELRDGAGAEASYKKYLDRPLADDALMAAVGRMGIAQALEQQGKPVEAIAELRKLSDLKLHPYRSLATLKLARLYVQVGDRENAQALLEQLLSDTDDPGIQKLARGELSLLRSQATP